MDTVVGYGKPPVATRFQKGKSGNPGGRPGPRRELEKLFQQALSDALLAAPEDGREHGTVCDRFARHLVNSAMEGDFGAMKLILSMLPGRGDRVRVPSWISRALDAAQNPAAHSQGISTPIPASPASAAKSSDPAAQSGGGS